MMDAKPDIFPLPNRPNYKDRIAQALSGGNSIMTDDRSVFELAKVEALELKMRPIFIEVTKDNFDANDALNQISDQSLPPNATQMLKNKYGESRWHKDMWDELTPETAQYFSNVVVFVDVQDGVTANQPEYANFSQYLRGTQRQLEEKGVYVNTVIIASDFDSIETEFKVRSHPFFKDQNLS